MNGGYEAPAGFAGLRIATVTLSAADVNGMFAAPVQVIPAQGAGTLIVVNRCVFNAVGSTAFTAGGNIALYFGAVSPPVSITSNAIVSALLTTLPANQVGGISGQNGAAATVVPSSIAVNAGIFLSNITQNFAGGAGSSLVVTVQYYVLTGVQ